MAVPAFRDPGCIVRGPETPLILGVPPEPWTPLKLTTPLILSISIAAAAIRKQ